MLSLGSPTPLTSKASWDTNIFDICQSLIENGLWIDKTVELALFSSNFKHSPLLQADRYKGYSIQVSFAERTSKNNRIECQVVIQTYLRYPRHLSSSDLTPCIPKIIEHLSRCFFTDAHFRCCWAQMVHVSRRKDGIFHHRDNLLYLFVCCLYLSSIKKTFFGKVWVNIPLRSQKRNLNLEPLNLKNSAALEVWATARCWQSSKFSKRRSGWGLGCWSRTAGNDGRIIPWLHQDITCEFSREFHGGEFQSCMQPATRRWQLPLRYIYIYMYIYIYFIYIQSGSQPLLSNQCSSVALQNAGEKMLCREKLQGIEVDSCCMNSRSCPWEVSSDKTP